MLLHILYEFTIHNHQCINDDIFSRMKNSSFTILFHRYKILNKDTFYYAHFFCLLSSNHKIYNLSYRSSSVNYWILLDNFPSHWLTVPTIYFALFIELSIQWKTFFISISEQFPLSVRRNQSSDVTSVQSQLSTLQLHESRPQQLWV